MARQAALPREVQAELPQEVDPKLRDSACQQLDRLLSNDDAAAEATFSQHAASLAAAYPAEFPDLRAAVESYDFEQALKVLREMVRSSVATS